jgi:hypothetical protein
VYRIGSSVEEVGLGTVGVHIELLVAWTDMEVPPAHLNDHPQQRLYDPIAHTASLYSWRLAIRLSRRFSWVLARRPEQPFPNHIPFVRSIMLPLVDETIITLLGHKVNNYLWLTSTTTRVMIIRHPWGRLRPLGPWEPMLADILILLGDLQPAGPKPTTFPRHSLYARATLGLRL